MGTRISCQKVRLHIEAFILEKLWYVLGLTRVPGFILLVPTIENRIRFLCAKYMIKMLNKSHCKTSNEFQNTIRFTNNQQYPTKELRIKCSNNDMLKRNQITYSTLSNK